MHRTFARVDDEKCDSLICRTSTLLVRAVSDFDPWVALYSKFAAVSASPSFGNMVDGSPRPASSWKWSISKPLRHFKNAKGFEETACPLGE